VLAPGEWVKAACTNAPTNPQMPRLDSPPDLAAGDQGLLTGGDWTLRRPGRVLQAATGQHVHMCARNTFATMLVQADG
jgi:hypothetical protein